MREEKGRDDLVLSSSHNNICNCNDRMDLARRQAGMSIMDTGSFAWGFLAGLTGRVVFMKNIMAKIVAWFSGDLMQKIISCIPAIVAEVELMASDGIITADERKAFALKAVNIVAEKFNFKMNGWTKWVVSAIIDNIAKKLPTKSIQIPQIIMDLKKQIGG